jgi:uncharacterized cupin superfamily protein
MEILPMHLQQATDDQAEKFGGYTFRRLYPWHGVIDTPWGGGWAVIKPGERTDPHWHDEEETFMILAGVGEMRVGDQARPVKKGDVVWIPRGQAHTLRNTDAEQELEMLCVWWGGNEKTVNVPVDI